MDKVKVAGQLAELGQQEADALATLARIAKRRCAILRRVAEHDGTPEIVALSAAPKIEPPDRA